MGGGLLAGGLLGALGGAGLARGINVMRGGGPPWVGWSGEALGPMVEAALLRYLAVAHFGRGRGQWSEGEAPAHWREVVAGSLVPHREPLQALWRSRSQTDRTECRRRQPVWPPGVAAACCVPRRASRSSGCIPGAWGDSAAPAAAP